MLDKKIPPAKIRESDVEKYFVAQVEKAGGEVRKLKWIGRSHAPDRFVALNGAHLVELKRPGKVARPGQHREHDRLKKNGVNTYLIDSLQGVDLFIEEILKCQNK